MNILKCPLVACLNSRIIFKGRDSEHFCLTKTHSLITVVHYSDKSSIFPSTPVLNSSVQPRPTSYNVCLQSSLPSPSFITDLPMERLHPSTSRETFHPITDRIWLPNSNDPSSGINLNDIDFNPSLLCLPMRFFQMRTHFHYSAMPPVIFARGPLGHTPASSLKIYY